MTRAAEGDLRRVPGWCALGSVTSMLHLPSNLGTRSLAGPAFLQDGWMEKLPRERQWLSHGLQKQVPPAALAAAPLAALSAQTRTLVPGTPGLGWCARLCLSAGCSSFMGCASTVTWPSAGESAWPLRTSALGVQAPFPGARRWHWCCQAAGPGGAVPVSRRASSG